MQPIVPLIAKPQPKAVTIQGKTYNLIAFYFNDEEKAWDKIFRASYLGNFYPCDLTLTAPSGTTNPATFHTAEAAFQATKCWNTPLLAKFEAAMTGNEAFSLKKQITHPDHTLAGFGDHDKAMNAVLEAKYSDKIFRAALLDTGDAYLLEHNEKKGRESYWSDDYDGIAKYDPLGDGLNHLGKALMGLRKQYGGAGVPAGTYAVSDFSAAVIAMTSQHEAAAG